MKDKLKTGGEVLKGMLETGGKVADKVLDKSTDVATTMMSNMTGLISKLSDDIGVMADRILTMEERIGLMADRIVKTEELMAKLTATMANKDLDLPIDKTVAKGDLHPVVLKASTTEAPQNIGPALTITDDPEDFLLYVSTDPLFRDGSTVVSQVNAANDYDTAWKRSISALKRLRKDPKNEEQQATVVAVAVRTVAENERVSALSNSIDVTVYGYTHDE